MIGWVSEKMAARGRTGMDARIHADPQCAMTRGAGQLVPVNIGVGGYFWPRRSHAAVSLPWCSLCQQPEAPGEWADRAACKGAPSEWFFAEGAGGGCAVYREARAICASCPVLVDCRVYAVRVQPEFGFQAGMTPDDRERVCEGRTVNGRSGGRPSAPCVVSRTGDMITSASAIVRP
jgi:WhiB family redox-sensing transcriptional regulator